MHLKIAEETEWDAAGELGYVIGYQITFLDLKKISTDS